MPENAEARRKLLEILRGVDMGIVKEINGGESKVLEFKEKFPNNESIAKTVVAFSNTSGGKIVFGVNDSCEIIGINEETDVFELQDKIASIIYDYCYSNIIPEIYTKSINDKIVLVVEIFRGNLLPYYLKKYGRNKGVYIRIGATNRQAGLDNIVDLERQRGNSSFDQESNYEVDFDSIDLTSLKEKFEQHGKSMDMNVMKNLKLVREENGVIYPTNGLLVILGMYEHCRIKCSRFKGTTMEVFIDRKEYEGDVFTQLYDAENFIKNHISLRSEIEGLQRKDFYEIPIEAIRESLVNAVVHRDYVNRGRDIKVGVYDDILNIVSPGGFPNTITQDDIIEGRSEIRNKTIARVLKELNYIEQWGTGIKRIRSSCKAAGLKEPEIQEKGDFVNVNLFRKDFYHDENLNKKSEYTVQEKEIIDYLKRSDGRITTNEVTKILKVKERRARYILNEMVGNDMLEKVGRSSNTYYCEKNF